MKKIKKLVRVTDVLGFVESAWKEYWWRAVGFDKADKISRQSSQFGTKVHKLVQEHLCGNTLLSESLPEEKCAFAILDYLKEKSIEPLFDSFEKSLEVEVKDEKLGLIGHFDYLGIMNKKPIIIDFKTSNKMRKSFPLQKSAYAKMANKQFLLNIDNGLTIRSHWDEETKEVEFEDKYYPNLIKTYWPKFKSCLNVYKYFK